MEFSDLLRPGLRGVKSCHKCKSFNGNRARYCKNTKCNAIFLAGFQKPMSPSHAVKLTTNLSSCVYSVRVRDKGPDYRGFVVLDNRALSDVQPNSPDICYVECCAQQIKNKSKEDVFHLPLPKNDCVHIRAARSHFVEAEPLSIVASTVNLLDISQEIKDEILQMKADDSANSLVQRVSKNTMAVKCTVTKRNPLGYLHILFVASKIKPQRFNCTCELFGVKQPKKKKTAMEKKNSPEKSILGLYKDENDDTVNFKKCIHFYMCIAAFVFNTKCYEEFQCYVDILIPPEKRKMLVSVFVDEDDENIYMEKDQSLLSIISSQENFIELTEDVSTPQELTGGALSPFVTQVIELPNGNGHMIELHAELHSNELQNSENYSDNCGYELKDIVVYKTNNNNDIVKTCDVLLANSADNVISTAKSCPVGKSESLDIQIMLSDSGNLINLSNIIVDENPKEVIEKTQDSQSLDVSPDDIDISSQGEFWKNEKDVPKNSEFIDIQELSLQKNHNDHVYTIAGDDCSLKIISLDQYDSLFGKKDIENVSDAPITTSYHFLHNDVLVGNTVEDTQHNIISDVKAVEKSHLFNDSALTTSDSDEEMFFLAADNSDDMNNHCDISLGSIVHTENQQNNSILEVKNIPRKRKKLPSSNNYLNPMLSDYSNFQNISVVNTDKYVCNDLPIEFCNTSTFLNNNIYEMNTSREHIETSPVKNNEQCDDILLRKPQRSSKLKKKELNQESNIVHESEANFAFTQWLSSVTENINQTMHYQFSGKPDALVFHIPQLFFECLQERINMGAVKRRLPNHTSEFVRKDAVPLGKFTKYTWNIINIFHLKKIFDTSHIQLEITRFFKQNLDGTFTHIVKVPSTETSPEKPAKMKKNHSKKLMQPPLNTGKANIKPGSLITYLRVGFTEPNQNVPTPFCIEWIPNLLPKTKIGELRLVFEYGRKTNYVPQDSAARVVYKILKL